MGSALTTNHSVDLLFSQFPIEHLRRPLIQQSLACVQDILMPLWNFDSVRIRCEFGPDGFQKCKLLGQRQLADFGLSNHEFSMAVAGAGSN